MFASMAFRVVRGFALAVSVWLGLAPSAAAPAAPKSNGKSQTIPFEVLEMSVQDHLAAQPNYLPDDLLARSDVEKVLDRLALSGWQPVDRQALLDDVLADDEFLVRELRTAAGRKFMRKISGFPNAYDRLDRLAKLPNGKRTIADLIGGPGGAKLIEYLTTASGGKELGKMLGGTPKGTNFNRPTGTIYTSSDLIRVLKREHGKRP